MDQCTFTADTAIAERVVSAFPDVHGNNGLSKREYIAIHLMAGMLARDSHPDGTPEHLAMCAVGAADILIKELAK